MARIPDQIENKRELVEGDLACLGNALILLRLVAERVDQAVKISRQADLLSPAQEDLKKSIYLIRSVQARLAASTKKIQ